MSCGISVSFPTLSRTQRQVAHALLTRPPLSIKNASRRINLSCSVRLECVMHAASVHPEPGSNSRIIISYLPSRVAITFSSSYSFLASFTLLSIYNSFDEISYFALRNALYNLSCCSIFNDRRRPLSGQLDYYTTPSFICQELFLIFLKKFLSAKILLVKIKHTM